MQQLYPEQLQQWIKEGKQFTLVDVREGFEHEAYNIGGIHIPLGDLLSRKNELPETETLVFYCEKGIRSMVALQRLQDEGFSDMYNLVGGMSAWRAL